MQKHLNTKVFGNVWIIKLDKDLLDKMLKDNKAPLDKMKKLLVVGGTGFIGFHVIKEAIKRKWQVNLVFH